MAGRRAIARDLTQALLVLALVFLNFAHVSPARAAYDAGLIAYLPQAPVQWTDCGSPGDADRDHAPCHACRLGDGAALPPPPALAARDGLGVAPVYGIRPAAQWPLDAPHTGQARAPPSVLIS